MLPRASCPPLASRNALQLPTERSGTTTTLCNPQHARPTTAAPARVHHSAVPQQHCLSVHLARAPGVHAPSLPQPSNSSQLLPPSSRPFVGSLCDPSPLLPPPSILPLVPSSLCNASEHVPCAHVQRATSRARKAAPATQKHPNAHQPYISHTSAIHQPYISHTSENYHTKLLHISHTSTIHQPYINSFIPTSKSLHQAYLMPRYLCAKPYNFFIPIHHFFSHRNRLQAYLFSFT